MRKRLTESETVQKAAEKDGEERQGKSRKVCFQGFQLNLKVRIDLEALLSKQEDESKKSLENLNLSPANTLPFALIP